MTTHSFSVAINASPGKGELTVLFSGHAQTAPEHNVGPQVLDYYLVHYIRSGSGRFMCMGKEYTLHAGDCFFIFPGELVRYVSNDLDPWQYGWIGFKGDIADQLLASMAISAQYPVVSNPYDRRTSVLFHQLEATLRVAGNKCDLHSGGLLRIILAHLQTPAAADLPIADHNATIADQTVEQAIRWLTLQYSQPVSIENMAHSLGYHRTHLTKIFKQHTGLSPQYFLLKLRMERAKLLLHEPFTIEQVASSVGFTDALYFSKQFKKWQGCTPTEYRSNLLNKQRYDCSPDSD